jgi:hypothetical protein
VGDAGGGDGERHTLYSYTILIHYTQVAEMERDRRVTVLAEMQQEEELERQAR